MTSASTRPTDPVAESVYSDRMMPFFVINLARDRARLEALDSAMRALDLDYERVDGFDGRRGTPRVQRWLRREFFARPLHRPMTFGEVGCTFSHLRALRRIITRRLPHAVVLEDDVEFSPGFVSFVRNELPVLLQVADVIKLEGLRDQRSSRGGLRLARTTRGDLFIPLRPALGSAAYAVNARGARALFRTFKRIDRPLDHRLAAYDLHGAVYAELVHFPVSQNRAVSNIKAERDGLIARRRSLAAQIAGGLRMFGTGLVRTIRMLAVWGRDRLGLLRRLRGIGLLGSGGL